MELNPGQLIGNYRVVRPLGQGGMGTVYEVEHVGLRKRTALKVFAAEGSKRDFLRKRFLAEGRILSRLDHPRLVRVFDLEIDAEADVPYFAMDLVLDSSGEPCVRRLCPRSPGLSPADWCLVRERFVGDGSARGL